MAKFRLQRLRAGRKQVVTTDSAADYLRCLIDEMAGDFNVLCHVSVTERPGHWMRVEVTRAPEAALVDRTSEFRFGEFANELHHIFRTFYDLDATVADRQLIARGWTIRHRRGCPWI